MKRIARELFAATLVALLAGAAFGADEWRYVAPGDDGFAQGARRLARLSDEAPDELAMDVTPRGKPRFAQLRPFNAADVGRDQRQLT